MLRCSAVLLLAAGATADLTLATFDGAKGTSFNWRELNDPVMGGASNGTFNVDTEHKVGVMDGNVNLIPSLKAPGFIKFETCALEIVGCLVQDSGFADGSEYAGGALELDVRSSTPSYKGFKFTIAADSVSAEFGCSSGNPKFGCYKVPFAATAEMSTVRVPLSSFSSSWSAATGEQTKTCAEDPSVCLTATALAKIQQLSFWAEGALGHVHLEVSAIRLTTAPAPPTPSTVCKMDEYCCPDAKHCLKPTFKSCAAKDATCASGEVCCPLTKECVVVGAACTSPCASTEFCCPDAKHCLTPVNPGVICDPGNKTACAAGQVCCPVAHECVTVGKECTAP